MERGKERKTERKKEGREGGEEVTKKEDKGEEEKNVLSEGQLVVDRLTYLPLLGWAPQLLQLLAPSYAC